MSAVNRTTSFNCRSPILSWIVTSIQHPPETIRAFPINQPIHLIPYPGLAGISRVYSRISFRHQSTPLQHPSLLIPFSTRNTRLHWQPARTSCTLTFLSPWFVSTILFSQRGFNSSCIKAGTSNSRAQRHEFHLVELPLGTISSIPPVSNPFLFSSNKFLSTMIYSAE